MSVCCRPKIVSYLVNRAKDENDSEVNCFQNVHIHFTACVATYAGRCGFCTDSTCFSDRINQRPKPRKSVGYLDLDYNLRKRRCGAPV